MNCKCLLAITRLFTALLVSFLFSVTADSLAAQTITHVPLYTFDGNSVGALFGISVSGAGDVNGDGIPDLIVGASNDDTNNGLSSGSARVLSGIDGSVLYTFNGDGDGDEFGESVSGAGDVNGDGFADLIVGDPGVGSLFLTLPGSVRVLSGIDGSVLYSFEGDSAENEFGASVSSAGDVNGDGFADLIVGAPFDFSNLPFTSYVRVFSGIDGSILYTINSNSPFGNFGESVSGAGDVNGDGTPDLIAGAPDGGSGSARVLSGSDGSELYTFNDDSGFGRSVSGAGDVNGDGFADLIVGGNGARVFSGIDGSVLYNFDGDNGFGASVSGAGDVNGDGFADLIVGAPSDDNNGDFSGSARVLSGSDGSVLYTFNGDNENDFFGGSVSGAGDINGDGIDDFIVGARSGGAIFAGFARVFVSARLGDCNLDRVVNFSDIPAFISILIAGDYLAEADTNEDGVVDFSDIPLFIEVLLAS